MQKKLLKRYYYCHFNTRQTQLVQVNERKRKHASRNTDCPAKLVLIINRIPTKYSRASKQLSDDLIKTWPCVISFQNNHNHTIDSAAALSKRPISDKTINEVLEYFNRGHSVASAYHTFCFSKMEEHGDKYEEMMADRQYFPTKSDFSNIWNKYFQETIGFRSGKDALETLEKIYPKRTPYLKLNKS